MKKSGFAIVKVSQFKGESAKSDTNGRDPLYLHPVAGEVPNRNVLSGTIAYNEGFIEGNTYLAQWTLGEVDPEYGQRVNWTNVSGDNLSAMEIVEISSGKLFNGEAGSIMPVNEPKAKNSTDEVKTSKTKASAQEG